MPFFPVDDGFAFHAKARAAGNAAIGLWARAGAYCMWAATDGVLQRHELEGLGKPAEAKRLVDVALWHAHGHDCDQCPQPPKGAWVFHEWPHHGPYKTSQQIKDYRAANAERQRRHRAKRNVTDGVSNAVTGGVTNGERSHTPSPSPSPSVVVKSVSQVTTISPGNDGLTDADLDKIRHRLGAASVTYAMAVAAEILTRADAKVLRPLRYVLAAIDAEPDRYRPTPGPVTKADECSNHPGQRSSNCGGCRADRLAGDA
jgi:hypothetical protein